MKDRRTFIISVAFVVSAAPLTGFAQQPGKVWRIGFLSAYSRRFLVDDGRFTAFLAGMRDLGYLEGKNLVIEGRYADGHYERLPEFASELTRLNVDVIVAAPSPAIRAAQQATTTIPIVFPATGDPVGSGFVASLARPGGNLTGLSNTTLDVAAKTLDLLRTILPRMSLVAVLANPGSSTEAAMLKSIAAAAQKMGVQVLTVEARTPGEIEAAFATMRQDRAEAVVVVADALMNMQRRQIAELAIKFRLPSITQGRIFASAGGLMSYGADTTESYRRAAAYVDKILRGANPGDLPVEQPTKLELVINLKTGKALGLTIPQSLLLRADEVLQ